MRFDGRTCLVTCTLVCVEAATSCDTMGERSDDSDAVEFQLSMVVALVKGGKTTTANGAFPVLG